MQGRESAISGYEYRAEYLKVKAAAELIADAGGSASATERALRRFAAEDLIQWREQRGTGTNAHRLHAPSDIAVAAILARITSDFGVADRDALRAISAELYRLIDGKHAITLALAEMRQGAAYVCRVAVDRSADGERRFAVRIGQSANAGEARAVLIIALQPLLSLLIEWLGAEILPDALLNPPKAD